MTHDTAQSSAPMVGKANIRLEAVLPEQPSDLDLLVAELSDEGYIEHPTEGLTGTSRLTLAYGGKDETQPLTTGRLEIGPTHSDTLAVFPGSFLALDGQKTTRWLFPEFPELAGPHPFLLRKERNGVGITEEVTANLGEQVCELLDMLDVYPEDAPIVVQATVHSCTIYRDLAVDDTTRLPGLGLTSMPCPTGCDGWSVRAASAGEETFGSVWVDADDREQLVVTISPVNDRVARAEITYASAEPIARLLGRDPVEVIGAGDGSVGDLLLGIANASEPCLVELELLIARSLKSSAA